MRHWHLIDPAYHITTGICGQQIKPEGIAEPQHIYTFDRRRVTCPHCAAIIAQCARRPTQARRGARRVIGHLATAGLALLLLWAFVCILLCLHQ